MTDLFDDARPIRDATVAEYERCLDDGVPEPLREGYRVGIHMASVLMAATAKRLGGLSGPIEAEGLMNYVAVAIAQGLAYGAMSFRPMQDGKPIPGSANLIHLANLIVAYAMNQVQMQEQGLQDFFVPFQMNKDGSISVKQFDFQDMMNKGGAT